MPRAASSTLLFSRPSRSSQAASAARLLVLALGSASLPADLPEDRIIFDRPIVVNTPPTAPSRRASGSGSASEW